MKPDTIIFYGTFDKILFDGNLRNIPEFQILLTSRVKDALSSYFFFLCVKKKTKHLQTTQKI